MHTLKTAPNLKPLLPLKPKSLKTVIAAAFIAVSFLLSPDASHAKMNLNPEAQLAALSSSGEYEKAVSLIESYYFDEWSLGRAAFVSLKKNKNITSEREDFLKMLISDGADLSYTDSSKKRILQLAIEQGDLSLVKFLLENGADPFETCSNGIDAKSHALALHGESSDIASLFSGQVAVSQPPTIKNIALELRDGILYISYDLVGSSKACVALEGSLDGGENYGMRFKHSAGDIGKGVNPGKRKQIVWKLYSDYPKGLDDAEVVLDVVATNCG